MLEYKNIRHLSPVSMRPIPL